MTTATIKKQSMLSLFLVGARVKTLTASAYPVILGMVLARYEGFYDIYLYLATIFTAVFLQMGCNFANDYFDGKANRDSKDRKGPIRLSSDEIVNKQTLFLFMAFCFFAASISCYPLIIKGGRSIFMMLLLGISFAIFYSKGKYSLANTGLASPVVFFVFGPLATAYCYFFQAGFFSLKACVFGFVPGCLSMMMFAMNNLRDIEEDRKANKKTLIVRFGFAYGKKEFLAFMLLSMLIPTITIIAYKAPVITLLPLFSFIEGRKIVKEVILAKDSNDIVTLFPRVAKYNILFSLLSIIGWRIATI